MSDKMEIYYFSPTGGTKKVSDIFAAAVGKDAVWHDLGDKQTPTKQPQGELIIVAAPVFAGRIPSVVREKIKTLAGEGKQAVTIAVYGNRAYEDALLEMNDILIRGGFTVIASAAFVAQHSIVPELAQADRMRRILKKSVHLQRRLRTVLLQKMFRFPVIAPINRR